MKRIFEKINFRQPKYMLPAILYIPLLGASYFIFDLFNAEKAEIADKTLQTTEFLNPDLPDATIKGGDPDDRLPGVGISSRGRVGC